MTRHALTAMTARLRCAIYTRKSTEEGLDQDFNSLDAQREAGEAFIASQRHEGWMAIQDPYDDGGYTGGNMERPALKRLMADIEAGKIDIVVVYKVDRLSRSLLDFARLMEVFDRKKVSFVSVTQQFNTATSIGRLVLNILLSFAQFEREMISERTRDKMSAARRKGKWTGGRPPLGYDIIGRKLVINDVEAQLIRTVFMLYLDERSLLRVAEVLNTRGHRMKSWTTRKGEHRDGGQWDKAAVLRVLTSVVYLGKIEYREVVYQGEHPAIVDEATFNRVAALLKARRGGAGNSKNTFGFLLRGLIRCRACGSVMTSSCTTRKATVYRYYTCTAVARRGRAKCPVRAVPAEAIERFVVERIQTLGREPSLVDGVVAQAQRSEESIEALNQEERQLSVEYARLRAEAKRVLGLLAEQAGGDGGFARERLGELDERAAQVNARCFEIRQTLAAAENGAFARDDIEAALAMFVPVWEALQTHERTRILRLLIEHIDYDGVGGELAINFRPLGVKLLAREAAGVAA
jgi:site-specific DNA recombinase